MSAGGEGDRPTESDHSSPSSSYSSGYVSEETLAANSKAPEIFQNMDWKMHIFGDGQTEETTRVNDHLSRKTPVIFNWSGLGETVFVAGSYDGWKQKTPLVRSESGFCTIIEVPTGTHQYKFLVNGRWSCNPDEPKVSHESGAENNVITVKSSDYDVFEALDADDVRLRLGASNRIPPHIWSQNIPSRQVGPSLLRSGPPLLPPHLLNTVLNRETVPTCDPTLLQEPTHVVLNHLYTSSIKDGVMVLGVTHRYRKKYITTLLYKPT